MFRALEFLLFSSFIVHTNGEEKNYKISEVIIDFAIKLMRNFWKQNNMDPDVINNFSRMYKNIFMNTSMNLTVLMVTDEYILKGISNLVRNGDVNITYKYPKIFASINCSVVFLRIYFNYAVNYEDNVADKSWTNFGKNEYFISDLDLTMQFHLDLKSQKVKLDSLKVDEHFQITVGEEFKVDSLDEVPVTRSNQSDFVGVLNNAPGKEVLRNLMEDRFKYLVESFVKTLSDEMI